MTSGTSPDSLEVVYYTAPVPRNQYSLTFVALVFDKVHFPNVYLPKGGYDEGAVRAELRRLAQLGPSNYDQQVTLAVLHFLLAAAPLREICYFTGTSEDVFGKVAEGTDKVVEALDLQIHGPPPEGFIPTYASGYTKGLPGGDESIHYPGVLHYPANAMIYAARSGLPLLNDEPILPVPALGGQSAKDNAKLLSTILAMECASLVLPKIRPLGISELLEAREELKPYLQPFRLSLLRLAAELNKLIGSASAHEEIVRAAQFTVQTSVYPSLAELRAVLEKPSKRWFNRAFDVAKQVPELAQTSPPCRQV